MSRLDFDGVSTLLGEVNDRINHKHRGYSSDEFSFIIDQSKSDPAAVITVLNDGAPAAKSDEWMTLLGLRPCILRNGEVVRYLDINDYSKDKDGNDVNLTTLGDDVMLEIPKMGYKVEKLDIDKFKITVTKRPNDPNMDYSAFSYDYWNDCDKLYYGIYKGHVTGEQMFSSKGKVPTGSMTLNMYRDYAKNRGAGYFAVSYAADELLHVLYCLTVQNTNGQFAVGVGHTSAGGGVEYLLNTGGSEAYGPFMQLAGSTARTTNSGYHSKCLGVEDFWGNIWQFEDGLIKDFVRDGNKHDILRAKCASDFNSTGEGYIKVGTVTPGAIASGTTDGGGYTTKMCMKPGCLFLQTGIGGSVSTYFSDYGYWHSQKSISESGGDCDSGFGAGPFHRSVYSAPSSAGWAVTSRLMYLHKTLPD